MPERVDVKYQNVMKHLLIVIREWYTCELAGEVASEVAVTEVVSRVVVTEVVSGVVVIEVVSTTPATPVPTESEIIVWWLAAKEARKS